jgi:activator of HSP90 ATPase
LTNQLAGSGGSGLSSWNTAGTWEERNHTAWAESRVTEMVVGFVCPPTTSDKFTAKLVSIKSFKGDATVVMVRGKPRSGFDFDVTIAWEAVFLTGDVDGLTGDGEKGTCRISQSRHTICP